MQFFNFKQTMAIALGTSFLAFSGAQAATKIEVDRYGPQGSYLGPWGYLRSQTFSAEHGSLGVLSDIDGAGVRVTFWGTDSDDFLSLYMRTAMLQPLTEGFYEDARKQYFDYTKPYLSFGLNGVAFTTTTGAFQVVELKKDLSGAITSFAASFRISTPQSPIGQPTVVGRLWFNSDALLSAVPEPQGLALMFAGLAVVAWAAKRRTVPLA